LYRPALNRFLTDEHGQDLIEYGFLLGILLSGLALLLPILLTRTGTAFTNWGTSANNLWVPSDPP
jgi:Flp pilus assembly pilin Flp